MRSFVVLSLGIGRAVAIALASLVLGTTAHAAALAPERPGKVDVYFVGFAGFGSQDVFLSEARGAAEVVARAYDSPDRALLLSNEPGAGVPAATPAGLAAALAQVAKTMNSKEDVAFVLLTSHGTEAGVALERGGKMLGTLSPRQVAAILNRSGIRNAVLVVSACHSGVFKSAATQNRLVITAARADRASFGCTQGARWTYFGEAFFQNALSRNAAPDKAFATARQAVMARERAQKFPPSEPQIAGGAAVVRHLTAGSKPKKS
jgi:hypothetical protein